MRTLSSIRLAFLAILVAPLGGQAENPQSTENRAKLFPLKFRLTMQAQEECGSGGQWVTPTTAATRAGLKTQPKFRSRQPLFASMQIGARRDNVGLVLDASSGEDRGYDILYVDANHDGELGESERFTPSPVGSYGTIFGPVKILVDSGAEKTPQWFAFQLQEFTYVSDSSTDKEQWYRNLQVMNAGYYLGAVRVGSVNRKIAFVDSNANGLFNEYYAKAGQPADCLLVDRNGDGKFAAEYGADETQPLGRYLDIGDAFYKLEVAADGSSVRLEPVQIPLGVVRSDIAEFVALVVNDEGAIQIRSKNGTAKLPAGTYHLSHCSYEMKDKSGKVWKFSGRMDDRTRPAIRVTERQATLIPFGPPLVPKVLATTVSKGNVTLNLSLRGAGGEVYDNVTMDQWQRPPVPKARITDSSGRELALLDFHYG
jgi:hypothetical protein